MDRVRETVYYDLFDVYETCNMVDFAKHQIPGFRPELGYGYYEFKQEELLEPEKNVVLIDKVKINPSGITLFKIHVSRMASCLLDLGHNSFALEEVINLKISGRKGHHPAWITQSGNTSLFRAIQLKENYSLVPCFCTLNTRQTSKYKGKIL